MKPLSFFINEKLIIKKGSSNNYLPDMPNLDIVKLNIPVIDDGNKISETDVWKTLKLPVGKFVIYLDKYRGNIMHFATFGDMISTICYCEEDFEDFDPKKDILFASDDMSEAMQWYLGTLGITDEVDEIESKLQNEEIDYYDAGNELNKLLKNVDKKIPKHYDSSQFIMEFHNGTDREAEEYFETDNFSLKNIKNNPQEWINDLINSLF